MYVGTPCIIRESVCVQSEVFSPRLRVAPAAMLATIPAVPSSFRVGPERHGYVYELVSGRLYQCVRGSDRSGDGEVLFLVREGDFWIAVDCRESAEDEEEVLREGVRIFRSGEEILEEGTRSWEWNRNGAVGAPDWSGEAMQFEAVITA